MPRSDGTCRRLRFPRRLRICRRRDFQRVLAEGRRGTDQCLTIWVLPNGLHASRLGLTVGRKHGGAVRRNRIKRVLREAFRLSLPQLSAGFDIVCAPRAGAAIHLKDWAESLVRLVTRLARRLTARG